MTDSGAVWQSAAASAFDLSVVVPAYNAAETIAAQLGALLDQQTAVRFEIIVADNGSTDATRSIVESTSALTSSQAIRIVDASQQRGPSFARNIGVEHALAPRVLFCDADDVVANGWIEAMSSALGHAALVAGPLEQDRLNRPAMRNVHGSAVATSPQVFADAVPFGASANLGVRRDSFIDVGGFDIGFRVGEDIDLCRRLMLRGVQLEFVPSAIVHYRNRSSLSDLFIQSVSYGSASVALFVQLAKDGIIERPRLRGVRTWLWLLRSAPMLASSHRRPRWIAAVGSACGRLLGSLRQRSLYV